jgi:hypothetical protein
MELTLDTFLTAVYVIVDELYQRVFAVHKPRRPGPKPVVSDSEVLTLMLLAQWRRDRSERAFLRYVEAHWRAYFPRRLSQSAFNRRGRALEGVLWALGPQVADLVTARTGQPPYEVLDGTPVPLMRRCRGHRHKCFGDEAGFGRGGSDREWFYGMDLDGAVSASGVLTGVVLVPANTEERWGMETLLVWRMNPERPAPTAAELAPILGPPHRGPRRGLTGPVASALGAGRPAAGCYLADRGLAGEAWQQHWRADLGAVVLTAADLPRPAPTDDTGWRERRRTMTWLSSLRQIAETAFATLVEVFSLPFPRARTYQGVRTRVAAKIAAFNVALYLNLCFGHDPFTQFNPFD